MLIVVGGQGRNVGKTSLAAALIAAFPEAGWTAIKISRHRHGNLGPRGYTLARQRRPDATDSGRYLAAGAARAYWLRTAAGGLRRALPALRRVLRARDHAIVESNSILDFIDPDLYLVVADPSMADAKASARRHRASADLVVPAVNAAGRLDARAAIALVRRKIKPLEKRS